MLLIVQSTEGLTGKLIHSLNISKDCLDVTSSGSNALDLIKEKNYSLVLLELPVSGISGIELLRKIRKIKSPDALPVMIISPAFEAVKLDEAFQFSANDIKTNSLSGEIVKGKKDEFLIVPSRTSELERLIKGDKLLGSSSNPYKIISDYSNDWEVFRDSNNVVVYCSPSVEKVLGYTADEYIRNVTHIDFIHQEDYEFVMSEYKRLLNGEFPDPISFRVIRKTGEVIWVETAGQPIYTSQGKYIGFRTSTRDISRMKETEFALKKSEEKFKKLVQFMDEGVIRTDNFGNINLANNAIAKIFEYNSPDEMIDRHVTDLYPAETRDKMSQELSIMHQLCNYEIFTKTRLGREVYLLCNIKEIHNEKGELFGREGIIRDITESKLIEMALKKSEADLKDANVTKEKFISILAHDLKTPFSGLVNLTGLLRTNIDSYSKEKIDKFLTLINEASTSTYLLLEELLEWARTRQDKIEFNPETTVLLRIIDDCVTLLANSFTEKNIHIDLDISQEIQVKVDRNMLRTIVRNLITNAIKFTPRSGQVSLSAVKKASMVEITVSDTGMGMDSRTMQSLFKIGETRSRNGTNGERGTGFGLLLCKEFVEKHGGTIHVESEVGRGSTFIFTMPFV